MVKILHTADIHLDSPFTLMDLSQSETRKRDLRSAFSAMVGHARDIRADLVLIAGDLFEHEYVTKDTVAFVTSTLAGAPECRFIISPGNHDPYTPDSPYKKAVFPDNVYIFTEPELSYLSFDDIGVDVYGYAFTSGYMENCPIRGKGPVDPDRINILCAHADTLSPLSKYCPITEAELAECGFDYAALGHIHMGKEPAKAGDTLYAYSGCIEGRDYSESGHKGALYCEFEKENNIFRHTIKPVRFSRRRYAREKINITGCTDIGEVRDMVAKRIVQRGYGDDTQLRLTLEGHVSPDLEITREALLTGIRDLYAFELADRTLPLYDSDMLRDDPTIKGEFFRALLPMLEEGSHEERESAAMALRYGLAAIERNDIIDF